MDVDKHAGVESVKKIQDWHLFYILWGGKAWGFQILR